MSEWICVQRLPAPGLMVLVLGRNHRGVALGCCDERGRWDVQPYKAAWYECEADEISHWAYVEGGAGMGIPALRKS